MPELPEVEVTKRGIEKTLLNSVIKKVYFDDKSLRKPFSEDLYKLEGSTVTNISRRGKYIVITTDKGRRCCKISYRLRTNLGYRNW